jgi:hypothetical protein
MQAIRGRKEDRLVAGQRAKWVGESGAATMGAGGERMAARWRPAPGDSPARQLANIRAPH